MTKGFKDKNGKFRPTEKKNGITINQLGKLDREATQEELECIKETEEMLKEEQKLPPASQMIRNLAVDHWKSLKSWLKGSQVITTTEEPAVSS